MFIRRETSEKSLFTLIGSDSIRVEAFLDLQKDREHADHFHWDEDKMTKQSADEYRD